MFAVGIIYTLIGSCLSVPYESDIQHLIVNGHDANIKDFPYMAGIYFQGAFTCGGSIYNKEWILTAGHCLYDVSTGNKRDPTKFSVQVGSSELNKGQSVPVDTAVLNPNFKFLQLSDDIALLKLKTPLSFGDTVKPVGMPLSLQPVAPGTPAKLSGWGFSKDGGKPMSHLQMVEIEIYPVDKCSQIYAGAQPKREVLQYSNICAMAPGGGKGQCTGDSGGPLVIKGQIQVGIVSFSQKPCANSKYPGVFTKVSYYIGWLKTVAGPPGTL